MNTTTEPTADNICPVCNLELHTITCPGCSSMVLYCERCGYTAPGE